ncbi:MAG: PQQ-binding-like beta-propeller repeat protein [Gammaproteobacteria bacterium]|jgi:glucose dehydrogenase|nr:PQQ-binding-like beta-propeller repeat protein [Gammaproteobacteria bacterium]MBT3861027.1 PQQ-binding-like beta-propeller repeat protein [Gammaproteobacteria bacterium]MBT3987815.1 PQQ-binding-like beta-propeller repeat protein [Gammaproteobacteria bacterium]MBT4255721.1 PQQ-binding-like beta-propeller repeat protein [Gammaproteobacteria bacterium]MBT4581538.1 PQQ-binding-like beta-propeller repeat protein [Gammaproteobacteria bacterium]
MPLHRSATVIGSILLWALAVPVVAQQADAISSGTEWGQYRGNLAGTGFSPLDQINQDNVADLQVAWSYSLRSEDENARGPNSQATPIVVNGIMYVPAGDRVVALDPVSGQEIWRHQLSEGTPSRRGVSYWPGDSSHNPRILFTSSRRLVSLDAATGSIVSEFGQSGEIDMIIPYNSVPMVYDNIIVVGANTPRGAIGGIGNARGFDVLSGEKVWEFNSVPQPGSLGHETWEGDSWIGRLGANAWPFYFTVDAERDLLFIPLASPIPFGYGGDRAGNNLFANSLVAVDIHSGEYKWHFQTIHHDLWDHDPPAPPSLFNIGDTPALGVTTKSGYLYILNRETGEPIYDVEERAMPASDVPGEETSPTQPIPSITPPMARVSYSPSDLVTAADTSAEHAAACAEVVANAGQIINQGAFTPWTYRPAGSGDNTTLLFPGLVGGPNWGGAAFDPNSEYLFVFAANIGTFGWMEEAEDGADYPFQRRSPRPASFDAQVGDMRLPCQKPPWGTLSAVDTTTGEIAWRQAVGVTESLPEGRQNTGRPGRAAVLVTASDLLFIAATDDNRLRALDTRTGNQYWEVLLPARGNANPMTYLGSDGNQYIVISATDDLMTFRLPN